VVPTEQGRPIIIMQIIQYQPYYTTSGDWWTGGQMILSGAPLLAPFMG